MPLILFLWVENKNGAKNESERESPIKISSGENNYKLILIEYISLRALGFCWT